MKTEMCRSTLDLVLELFYKSRTFTARRMLARSSCRNSVHLPARARLSVTRVFYDKMYKHTADI